MKSCPTCNRTYTDASLNFCLEDGTPLTLSAPPPAPGFDPNATIRYTDARATKPPQPGGPPPSVPPGSQPSYPASPPPSYPASPQPSYPASSPSAPPNYAAAPPTTPAGSAFGQAQRYTPPPVMPQPKKSSAVWWILGGAVVLGVIVVGATIMILALASMGSNSNFNENLNRPNGNTRTPNRNANANTPNSNANVPATLPALFTDDFSEAKWSTGNYAFGDIWYDDEQYHMRAKERSYLVIYAPTGDYNTQNATVSVTVRSVDGTPASTGFGLIIHGEKKDGQLEDYALLIFTGEDAQYEIIKHKGGKQSVVVAPTKSTVIRSGSSPNQLEIRAKGTDLSFYINGQYVDRITDTESFKTGVAGLYTSDKIDVAFDDLEIKR